MLLPNLSWVNQKCLLSSSQLKVIFKGKRPFLLRRAPRAFSLSGARLVGWVGGGGVHEGDVRSSLWTRPRPSYGASSWCSPRAGPSSPLRSAGSTGCSPLPAGGTWAPGASGSGSSLPAAAACSCSGPGSRSHPPPCQGSARWKDKLTTCISPQTTALPPGQNPSLRCLRAASRAKAPQVREAVPSSVLLPAL